MKAKQYVEKYQHDLLLKDYIPSEAARNDRALLVEEMEHVTNSAIARMFNELVGEFQEISKTRNAKTLTAKVAIYRELNDKWNSIADKINEANGAPLLKPDAIREYYFREIPELKEIWDGKSLYARQAAKMALGNRAHRTSQRPKRG